MPTPSSAAASSASSAPPSLGVDRDARADLIIIADRLISETPRAWTFQLNGLASERIGNSSFASSAITDGGTATWTRPRAALMAITLASSGSPSVESRLEENALAPADHRCFTVTATMGEDAGFLTALIPLATGHPSPMIESSRLTPAVTRIALTWPSSGDGDALIAWLNTGTEPMVTAQLPSPGLVQPGLTLLYRVADGAPTVTHYTMELPPIPDPSPFFR